MALSKATHGAVTAIESWIVENSAITDPNEYRNIEMKNGALAISYNFSMGEDHTAKIYVDPQKENIRYEVEMATLSNISAIELQNWCATNTALLNGAAEVKANNAAVVTVEWAVSNGSDIAPTIEKKLSNLNIILPALNRALHAWMDIAEPSYQ